LQFALYHTWHFTNRVLVQQNGPALDLLNGDAIGSNGGQPRHELEGQAGYNNNGIGLRFSANWQSATDVNGGTIGNPQSLRFSGLGTVGVRLFGDLGQRLDLVKAHPWMRGMRVAVSVDNLFDTRQRVTDAAGTTPVAYQPGYLNPLGRTVRLSVRKLFL
jgi:iron complex outermembrane receptor protein